jgi:acylphosphatase
MGMSHSRRRFFFSGQVQGVGFRYTCLSLARNFAVSGWVKNLECGRVEMVAEGEEAELDRFLDEIQREMGGFIKKIAIESEPENVEALSGFSVRH